MAFEAQTRSEFGTRAATALRAAGRVPVAISNHGADSTHVSLAVKDAEEFIEGRKIKALSLDGKEQQVLIKEINRNPITDELRHIDVLAVEDDTRVKTAVKLKPNAKNCPGIKAGGMLEQSRRTIDISCLAKDLPDFLDVDLSETNVGQTVYASSCILPEGAKLITGERVAVVSILMTRAMRKAETDERAAEG